MITYESAGAIATVTMDDGKVNALSIDMLAELHAALDRAEADGHVVVLTGRDGCLSAGFDLRVIAGGGPDLGTMLRSGFDLARRLLSFPTPTIVAASGHAIAMGFFMMVSADHRVGVEGAAHTYTANEVAIGLPLPRTAVEICRPSLSPPVLHRALSLAEVFTPATALAAGVLDELVPAHSLLDRAQAYARRLAALDMGAHAVAKQRVRAPALVAIAAAIEADDAERRR